MRDGITLSEAGKKRRSINESKSENVQAVDEQHVSALVSDVHGAKNGTSKYFTCEERVATDSGGRAALFRAETTQRIGKRWC
jgi:hypothetical protein